MFFKKFKNKFVHKKLYKIILILIIAIVVSTSYSYYKFNIKYQNKIINHVTIISKESVSESSITYLAKIGNKFFGDKILLKIYLDKKNPEIINNKEMLFFNRYGNYKYGDVILVDKKVDDIKPLKNDYEFNYKSYLNSKNIVATVSVYELEYVYKKIDILTILYNYKNDLNKFIDLHFSKNSELFKAIIYGEDLKLSDDIKNMFISIGQSISLSISGTNIFTIHLIIKIVFKLLNNIFIKFKIKEKNITIIFNLTLILFYYTYYIFSGYAISVLRVVIIYSLVSIGNIFKFKIFKFRRLILGSLILYLINPYTITSVSFILGVVATIGIYLVFNKINSFLSFKILKITYKKKTKEKINLKIFIKMVIQKIINITSIYISCMIFIIPVQIYYFNYFSFISLISNILINSLYFTQVYLGTLLIFVFKIPIISNIVTILNNICISTIYYIAENLTKINVGINLASPNLTTIILYYIVIMLIIFKNDIINNYIYKVNKNVVKEVKKIRKKYLLKLTSIIIILIILVGYNYIYTIYFNVYVNHFNVGQGNMSLIKNKDIAIVVDFGSTTTSSTDYILTNYMLKKGIKDIDYLIITHLHADHINGLYKLKDKLLNNEIVIKNIIYTIPKDETGFEYFIEFLNETKINKIVAEKGDEIKLDEITIRFLSPEKDLEIKSNDSINTHSLVSLISLHGSNHLFLGDSTVQTEDYIMNEFKNNKEICDKLNNLTSYVVGHHGSETSSKEEFLKFTSAKHYIMSAKKSKFNHPSPSILARFNKLNLNYHITEKEGNKLIKIK